MVAKAEGLWVDPSRCRVRLDAWVRESQEAECQRLQGWMALASEPVRWFTKIAVIRPGAIALLMATTLFTPPGTP